MGNYPILLMFENPRRGRQARNLTTNVPKILDLKSSSEQIFSENCRWVPLIITQDLYQTCQSNTCFKERYDHLDPLLGKLTLNNLNLSFQCGRSFEPRFLFTWPTAQVAMDTAENMVDICVVEVMYSCSTEGGRRKKV